ncbi:MAG TPA: dihydrofolate reductase family protein [Propionibacteriaceae bacterium]
MRNISATLNISMDGVIQGPGRPDEDTRGGFDRGGWAVPYSDEVMAQRMGEGMASSGAMLFGRRTYEDFYGYWPRQTENPFTPYLNQATKYVVSSTLSEPLPWQNSILLPGNPAASVADLKSQPGPDLGIVGSAQLVRSLLAAELIDRYVLLIYPLVLGQGRRLFDERGPGVDFDLVDSVTTSKGVIIATYESARAGNG